MLARRILKALRLAGRSTSKRGSHCSEDKVELTADQLHMLRHMLGINTPADRMPKPYRNYAACNPGDERMLDLEKVGAVERCRSVLWSEYEYWQCTENGKAAAIASHRTIRYPRSKRRYIKFLRVSDAWPGLTFREFLTLPELAQCRNEA